jgi:hypothetical protein
MKPDYYTMNFFDFNKARLLHNEFIEYNKNQKIKRYLYFELFIKIIDNISMILFLSPIYLS